VPDGYIESDEVSRLAHKDPTANAAIRNLERWFKEKKALKVFVAPTEPINPNKFQGEQNNV